MPSSAKSLVKNIGRIGKGIGIILPIFKKNASALADDVVELIDNYNYKNIGAGIISDNPGDRNRFWQEVHDIYKDAQNCVDKGLAEPG